MTIAKFEGHCWKDIVTAEILETYTLHRGDFYLGGACAIGHRFIQYKSSCGIYGHQANGGALRTGSLA